MKRHPLYPVAAVLAAMTTMAAMALPSSAGAATVKVSATSLNNTYAAMKLLKPLVSKGHGKVAALLPTTTTSTRYVEFDAPDPAQAFKTAGLSTSEYEIQNAQGSDATELTDAQTDITNGASVLLVDPLDSGVGAQIESYAKAHGVGVIDYDRLTLGGSRTYYVSFTNVRVGTLLGKGLASCVTAWHVSSPKVVVMHGAVTDNNATLFAQGYNAVMKPYFTSGKWSDVTNPAGTWTPPQALTEFQAAYTAHPTINAALIPNDENATPIITYLRSKSIAPKTFPTTGQDATLTGLQNVLSGYQCGTVYKPIYLEAQAAVALAMFMRADVTPPKSLVNGKTTDTQESVSVPSVLLTPEWVTTKNMDATVVKDNFVPVYSLCAGAYAADCQRAGI